MQETNEKPKLPFMQMRNRIMNEPITSEEFAEFVAKKDTGYYISLAKNPHLTEDMALALVGTVYLAHFNLMHNPSVSENVKAKIKEHAATLPKLYCEECFK